MLIPLKKLDPIDQEKCRQNGWIAFDPKYGSSLKKSPEKVKPGRQAKYFFYLPGVTLRVIWVKNDMEAMAIANNGVK